MNEATVAALYPKIRRLARSFEYTVWGCLDRADLAQIAAISAHQAIEKAGDRSDEQAIGYAMTKARWSMVDAFRQHLRRVDEVDLVNDDGAAADAPDPRGDVTFEAAWRCELARKLPEIVNRLPEALRTVLHGMYVKGLEQAEIGAALGVTQSRVSQLHSQAIRQIRDELGVTA